jgi:hypothetical protein
MPPAITVAEGDTVAILPGAPVPAKFQLANGMTGRVLDAEAPDDPDATGWLSIIFPHHQTPLRIHRRWVHLVTPSDIYHPLVSRPQQHR